MGKTSEILFEYLRDIMHDPSKAKLDIEKLDEEFVMLGKGLVYFAQCCSECGDFANALARGDLGATPPPKGNELAAPLKSLQASLRHLTWQTQQVAMGDYKQRVDFMGDFAKAFNVMIEQLAERQKSLEDEIELSRITTTALEQSNQFLNNITQYIPQQIIVVDRDSQNILFANQMAQDELENDVEYMDKILKSMCVRGRNGNRFNIEVQFIQNDRERCLSVSSYFIEWNKMNAEAFVINDISFEKSQIKELEIFAYQDTMTHLYNRYFGMLTLNQLLDKGRSFVLIFSDLDNLKYVNDRYGHNEGDKYIIHAAKCLRTSFSDAVVCRIGGDEFMVLAAGIDRDEAAARMDEASQKIQNDENRENKECHYSISYGIVAVGENDKASASDILSLADERMYEHKKMRKKARQC